jgi:hypothetical protein
MEQINDLSIPIACSLTSSELEARQASVFEKLSKAVLEKKETPDGYAFRFPSENEWLGELVNFIIPERSCCPFITFRLTAEAGNGPIWLELVVAEEAKPVVADLFLIN